MCDEVETVYAMKNETHEKESKDPKWCRSESTPCSNQNVYFVYYQSSHTCLRACCLRSSSILRSSRSLAILFDSFSRTALSYALASSVFFGAFTPSAPAIIRPAVAVDFSGRCDGDACAGLDRPIDGSGEYADGNSPHAVPDLRADGDMGVGGGALGM